MRLCDLHEGVEAPCAVCAVLMLRIAADIERSGIAWRRGQAAAAQIHPHRKQKSVARSPALAFTLEMSVSDLAAQSGFHRSWVRKLLLRGVKPDAILAGTFKRRGRGCVRCGAEGHYAKTCGREVAA